MIQPVLDFIALWSSRDLDRILDATTEDCFYHNLPWTPLIGREAIRGSLEGFIGSADEIDWIVHHAAETPAGVVLTERTDRFRIGGRWIEMPVMGTFELREGRIARWRDYFDAAQFQTAMAAVTAA